MKRIFTLLLSIFVVTLAMGQAPNVVVKKATVSPVIDGELDAVWDLAEEVSIGEPFKGETPTVGESTWRALWDDKGIYVFLTVMDNVFAPLYAGTVTGSDYKYDHTEIYFDVNSFLADGKGAQTDGNGSGSGHYQFAPHPIKDSINGEATRTGGNGSTYAYKVNDPDYVIEYFVPFSKLLDKDGLPVDQTAEIGFDVTIIDNDVAELVRNRQVWTNVGNINESWVSMDDCGTITLDGAVAFVELESLTVTGGTEITTDNGTLQLSAVVAPENATQPYKWTITNGTGAATISNTGLVTASRNGTVIVKAISADNFTESPEYTITISNQIVTYDEISILKNGDFVQGDDKMASWGFAKKEVFAVEDDWLVVNCTPQTNRWDINVNQAIKIPDTTTKYIIRFKAKASDDMILPLVNEDSANGYPKNGVSTSPYGTNSDWAIPVTTEAQWFELDVVFANLVDNSNYSFGFQPGAFNGTLYLDSVYMFKESDLEFLSTSSRSIADNQMNVYPNPVNNKLFVELSNINSKVAIYNSVGQKLMEKTATSNRVQFDVSALRKGMYIVKLSDGTSRKFVK